MWLTAMNTDNVAKLLTPQDLTYWSFPEIIAEMITLVGLEPGTLNRSTCVNQVVIGSKKGTLILFMCYHYNNGDFIFDWCF